MMLDDLHIYHQCARFGKSRLPDHNGTNEAQVWLEAPSIRSHAHRLSER
jgi:hypothetical protein